jgi:hypothetical protein
MASTCYVCQHALAAGTGVQRFMCDHFVHAICMDRFEASALATACGTCRSPRIDKMVGEVDVALVERCANVDVPIDGSSRLYHRLPEGPALERVWALSTDLEHRDADGDTALLSALRRRITPTAGLLGAADWFATNEDGDSPLSLMSAVTEVAERAPDGADEFAHPKTGRVPLHEAAATGAPSLGIWIRRWGDRPPPLDADLRTPLMLALAGEAEEIDSRLIDLDVGTEYDVDKNTALHIAWRHGRVDSFVDMILSGRFDVLARNDDGLLCFDVARI